MDIFLSNIDVGELKEELRGEGQHLLSYLSLTETLSVIISSDDPDVGALRNIKFNTNHWIYYNKSLIRRDDSNSFIFKYVEQLVEDYRCKWSQFLRVPKSSIEIGSLNNLILAKNLGFNENLVIELPLYCFREMLKAELDTIASSKITNSLYSKSHEWSFLKDFGFSFYSSRLCSSLTHPRVSIPYEKLKPSLVIPSILSIVEMQRFKKDKIFEYIKDES